MDRVNAPSQRQFSEWMVTQALAAYLGDQGKEDNERMNWLFGLQAEGRDGPCSLSDLCGFAWEPGKVSGGREEPFRDNNDDRGGIPSDDFRKTYLMVTPDFRYWTKDEKKQLIIEAKGPPKPAGQRDRVQAQRYFTYLRDSGHAGAIVYFAPNPKEWLPWLAKVGDQTGFPFGVVDWTVQVVPRIADELLRVVAESLTQTADLLKTALQLSKAASLSES